MPRKEALSVLTLNAGSSSVKFALFHCRGEAAVAPVLEGQFERLGRRPRVVVSFAEGSREALAVPVYADQRSCTEWLLGWLKTTGRKFDAVAHRVVHGGVTYTGPVRIDDRVLADLHRLVALAPLHQPHNIAGITAVEAVAPHVPQFACFDTAFHRTQGDDTQMYALPREYFDDGVRRYGFHGLSYEYLSRQQELHPYRRVVICHLGSGASACALLDGRSIDTTMGFTALDGLMMGTRCGNLDPGVVFHLFRKGLSPQEVEALLYKRSGLLAVSGVSADMRDVLRAADEGDAHASQAVRLYCHSVAQHVARLATTLRGLDALVFTAGVGQHNGHVRDLVVQRLQWLGVKLDAGANERNERRVSHADSSVAVWALPTSEERMLCQHALALLADDPVVAIAA